MYNGVDYNIGGVQYSHHLLEGIVSEETKCAAQIVYVANSAQVETVRTGCIDSNGSFVEKSHSKFLFKKNIDKDAVIKTNVTNEKGICIEYMFNEKGEIVSSFEKKGAGLFTLQKETGKRIPVNKGISGENINGVNTFTPSNNICSYIPEFDLRRGKEVGVRNYIAGCYVKLKEKTAQKLQAIVFYTFNNQKYSYSAKVDNTAVNVWQKIGVSLTVPKDTADDAMKISNFSLAIYDEAGNAVAAGYSDILIVPGGTMSTFLTSGTSKFELRSATAVELTDETDSITLVVGEELQLNEKNLVFNKINLTYNDLLETAKSMYINRNNTGFYFFYNGGKDRYANVKDVKIVFDSVKVPIADIATGYCNFVLTQYSADGGTVTDVMNTLNDEGILCKTTITVNSGDTSKSSTSYEYTTYDGRKLYEKDAYGVITRYEYDSFYNLTCVKRSGNGKEMLLSKTEYDEQGEYLEQTSAGYSSSRYEYNKPFETLKEEAERSYNLSNGIYSNTGLKKTVDYDENERIGSVKLSKESTTFFKNEVTYKDGKIRTVSDGNSKYGIKYDVVNDSVTYTAFDGETEVDLQKHYDRYDEVKKHNISTDQYFKGDGHDDIITSVTDDYGRTLSTDDGNKNIEYSYTKSIHENESQLVFRGYDGIALLSKVKDPYENKEYSYSYDYDGQMCGWEAAGKFSVRKLSANDTKYTFGENNNRSEKYKTEEKYDETVVNQPRVFGSKTYEDTQVDAQDNWREIELFNVGYAYDELGRIKTKTQNKGEYTYSYLTDGKGALLPNVRTISFAFGKDTGKTWTYVHGYDNRGNLSSISLTKKLGGQSIGTTYKYDEANRLSSETIMVGGTISVNNSYYYQENGKGRLIRIANKLDSNKNKDFYYDGRGRIDYYRQGAVNYKYTYDNYGNVVKKATGSTLYSCSWERGNLLKQVTKNGMSASYEYNHRCVRFRKTVNGVSTEYYQDGAKILGESRSDGKELRYFYDHDGLIGFKYGNSYYGYVKDGQDNIVAIVNNNGSLVAQYEYDSFGKTTVRDSSGNVNTNVGFIGNINPFRWKSFYYDVETGFYYANGRYYEVERGGYIDAIEADIVEGNAYNVLGLDRNGIMLLTLIMLAPYSETIATALQLYADPTYDPNEGVEVEETPKSWWKKHWWEVLVAAVNIVVGVVKLATGNVTGILNIISGICTLVGAIFSEQLAGAMGTATLGVQTIMIGAQSLACNPVYGIIAMAVGAACVAFATAEAQESLGYGNWLKDTVGMSDEVYNGVMVAVNVAAIAINIVGVKQCFKEGTLVACLNENGEEVRKPIETVAVGTLVLAYDEATGEKAYKPVVQVFKNETKRWCTVTVEVDGQEEQIVSTPGHKYYLPNNTESREIGLQQEHESYIMLSEKWVSACKLKSGDKVLLSDGKYGIIVSVKIEELESPEMTYNFEVADFHTYYVSDSNVLVHNMCKPESPKKLNNSEIKKFDAEGYKKTYVNNKGSRFDIFKDSANNDKIWLGSKDQKTWIETFEHLIDLLNGDW